MIEHYLILSFILFNIGIYGILVRKNIMMLFFATEIMLNAINIAFVALSHHLNDINGQIAAFFIIAIAASEVAIGLALLVLWYKKTGSIDMDTLNTIKN